MKNNQKPIKKIKKTASPTTPVSGEPKKPSLSIDQEIAALRNAILDGMKINVNIVARAIIFHSLFQHLDLDLAIEQTKKVMDEIDPIAKE